MTLDEQISDLKQQEETLITNNYNRQTTRWMIDGTVNICSCSIDFLTDERVLNIYKTALNIPPDTPLNEIEEIMHSRHESGLIECPTKEVKPCKIVASEEETKKYQAHLRAIRFQRQMLEEELTVTSNMPNHPQALKLMPLVSRRKHPELWSLISKTKFDGEEFLFQEPRLYLICGCTDEHLKEQIDVAFERYKLQREDQNSTFVFRESEMLYAKEQVGEQRVYYFDNFRNAHNKSLESFQGLDEMPPTPNSILCQRPIEVKEAVLKHRIGNILCRACFRKMPEQVFDGVTATKLGAKFEQGAINLPPEIDYCPRFIPILRKLTISEYLKTVKAGLPRGDMKGNDICYAGLLHSAMRIESKAIRNCSCSFEELLKEFPLLAIPEKRDAYYQEIKSRHNKALTGEHQIVAVSDSHCPNPIDVEKTFLVIEKRCDTCNYTSIEEKELVGYSGSEVKAGEVLGENVVEMPRPAHYRKDEAI